MSVVGPIPIRRRPQVRLLVDSCIGGRVVARLRSAGHDVTWVAEWQGDPGDIAILHRAAGAERVLVTRDKDFGDLVFRHHLRHSGILRIGGNLTFSEQENRVIAVLATYELFLMTGHLVTVDGDRVRVTRHARSQ